MAARIKRVDDQLPLSPPVFYVLLAVADQQRHGYAIMQEVERRTDGKIRLLPGSLYSTIKRMLSSSLIEECDGSFLRSRTTSGVGTTASRSTGVMASPSFPRR